MMGCQHNAKNTLDKNYLYFAEKRGAKVFAETRVTDVRPLHGKIDGSDGYQVTTERSTSWLDKQRRSVTARSVIFAGSALGTQELLFRLKQDGSLPNISKELGNGVRTNAESICRRAFSWPVGGHDAGCRHRFRHLPGPAHAHRGDTLPVRLGRHGPAGHADGRRQAGMDAHPHLDWHGVAPPAAVSAHEQPFRLCPRRR